MRHNGRAGHGRGTRGKDARSRVRGKLYPPRSGAWRVVLQVRFWGVRGSTPTPQVENLRYGGNTSCVEVRINGNIYIFDCGTGFRNLGKSLSKEFGGKGFHAHIFLSHFHWDHIQGIPFFVPLYENKENYFFFHSSSRTRGLQRAIEEQMSDPYFPVGMTEMAAHRNFYDT